MAVGIRLVQPIELRQCDGLDHREPLLRALAQVTTHVLARGTVEELPRRVAQPEERPAVGRDEKPLVVGHLERAGWAAIGVSGSVEDKTVRTSVRASPSLADMGVILSGLVVRRVRLQPDRSA